MQRDKNHAIYTHAYLVQGYDIDKAVEMADKVCAYMQKHGIQDKSLERDPEGWKPEPAEDIQYFVKLEKFRNTLDLRQNGVKLSLVEGKLRIRSSGVDKPYVTVSSYGKVDCHHTIDTIVVDVVTPIKGFWLLYNPECIVGVNFDDGCVERVNFNLSDLKQSEEKIVIQRGDRLILEVSKTHHKVRVHLTNYTKDTTCYLEFDDQDIVYDCPNTLDIVFSDDVITEIDLVYLECGLVRTGCCDKYRFEKKIDCDWEEREWFESDEFQKAHKIMVDNNTHIAYREKIVF